MLPCRIECGVEVASARGGGGGRQYVKKDAVIIVEASRTARSASTGSRWAYDTASDAGK